MTDEHIIWAESVADAQVGESLWFKDRYVRFGEPQRVVVTKRGRKILDVEFVGGGWPKEGRFRMDNGQDAKHGPNTGGIPSVVISEADRQLRERMTAVHETAKRLGMERRFKGVITDAQWEQIVQFAERLVD